jgi:hypothetical protein
MRKKKHMNRIKIKLVRTHELYCCEEGKDNVYKIANNRIEVIDTC